MVIISRIRSVIQLNLNIGSLTQAVQNGFWIVSEDINIEPSAVHSILFPYFEGEC
jgi:midasin (ATPase involved in ribosome maturation)